MLVLNGVTLYTSNNHWRLVAQWSGTAGSPLYDRLPDRHVAGPRYPAAIHKQTEPEQRGH